MLISRREKEFETNIVESKFYDGKVETAVAKGVNCYLICVAPCKAIKTSIRR